MHVVLHQIWTELRNKVWLVALSMRTEMAIETSLLYSI